MSDIATTIETSTEVGDLFAALSAAQGKFPEAKLDASNPHYRSRYASLASVREATQEHLSAHGLCLTQWPVAAPPGMVGLLTILGHSSGQWIRGLAWMPVSKQDAHGHGSAYTYLRRYAMSAVLAVSSGEDDDGNAAVAVPVAQPKATVDDQAQIMDAAEARARKLTEEGFGRIAPGAVLAGCLKRGATIRDVPAHAVGQFIAKIEGWRPKTPTPPAEPPLSDELGPPLPGTIDEETGEVTDA